MKILFAAYLSLCVGSMSAGEMQIVPANPPLTEFIEHANDAAIVLICKPNAAKTKLEVSTVLKGQEHYETIKDRISDYLPASDKEALATNGYREVVFIDLQADQASFRLAHSLAWWPQRDDILGDQKIRFLSHTAEDIESIIQVQTKNPNKAQMEKPSNPSD